MHERKLKMLAEKVAKICEIVNNCDNTNHAPQPATDTIKTDYLHTAGKTMSEVESAELERNNPAAFNIIRDIKKRIHEIMHA